ncbi:hypothetical protein Q4E93_13295 [Flavitalea sp. BT771]|uniref:hypothetical protein n=1 Tax=Flavitalea sp. BT771 TaxID=3063329 RepID=UPI0026E18EED|nr:hypothetical protein [Flavitalea sp. BT771]MDO6431574.1 hypothetical protein [Flavitalea sp. BT771]MDV6220482.1 hypothetical protein [Flavitalea sp. BT771]
MKQVPEVTDFMTRAELDARLGPMHISLYVAILHCWLRQGGSGPARISARDLMPISKIGGLTPMYRCLRELHEYGYIVYEPSFNPAEKSKAFLRLE